MVEVAQMINIKNLNENELKVLKAIAENEEETTGCTDEIIDFCEGLKENQIKGYISDLIKKELINSDGFQTYIINEKLKEDLLK